MHRGRGARCPAPQQGFLALWSDLPPEVRDVLFEQSLLVGDRHEAADLRHDTWALILKHQDDRN